MPLIHEDLEIICARCHGADFRDDGSCRRCQPDVSKACMGCGRQERGRGMRVCHDCGSIMAEHMIDPEQPRISDDSLRKFFAR